MALIGILSRDRSLRDRLSNALAGAHSTAATPSRDRFVRLVRERPITVAVVEVGCLSPDPQGIDPLADLRSRYPHLGLVLVVPRDADPVLLFRLGRRGADRLVLTEVDRLEDETGAAVLRASQGGATSLVVRSLSPYLARRELWAVRAAMDGVPLRWSAEEFSEHVGLSRPFLSERLKVRGLPSAGHLLLWARLLHAGLWLTEPGRTAESVSRQLEYSSGAAFRRALKHYTGATPSEVVARGGLDFVLGRFRAACGLPERSERGAGISVA